MASRQRAVDRGYRRGGAILAELVREVEDARRGAGLSYAEGGRALGLSRSQVSRIANGQSPEVSLVRLAALLSIVGLELSARAYPTGSPVRDAAQLALLARLRARVPSLIDWRTEVHLDISGDLRAWDAAMAGPGWTCAVDAETRATDVQAVQRRIALKQRDSGFESVILLLSDTRHNREFVRLGGDGLRAQFPIGARVALQRLGEGQGPGGNAIILL